MLEPRLRTVVGTNRFGRDWAKIEELPDLDALCALLQASVDEGLVPPPMKGRLGDIGLT